MFIGAGYLIGSMSVLPPKGDIETQSRDVRFVPKADICLTLDPSSLRQARHRFAQLAQAAHTICL